MAVYEETVTKVRDGDTFETRNRVVRLKDVWASESGTTKGDLATARLKQLIDNRLVTIHVTGDGSFGRDEANVWRRSDNLFINEEMRDYIKKL